jgi:adenylate cyclase
MTRFYLASLYGYTGRHEEARRVWRELLEIKPDFSVERFRRILPYREPATFDWFVDGIREARIVF